MIDYEYYMEEFLSEELSAMNSYMEEGDKSAVYKKNYYLRDNLQIPYVTKVLAKSANREKLVEFTGRFMDDHTKQLSTSGPVHIFTFGEKETKFLYEMFNVNGNMLVEMYDKMIEEAFYGKISKFISGWVYNAPHKILLTAMLIDAIQHEYEDVVTCCEYLWAFCEYPILYRMFWSTGVKEDVMNYTIEHLNTKFMITKVKNLQELLKYDAHSSVNATMDKLKDGVDNAYTDFMQRMRNQIKNKFKNISKAYYDNDKDNASQHNKASQYDDGSVIADQEGHTTNIAQVVDNTNNKFSTGEVNAKIAAVAANGSQVDTNNLIGYINQIYSTKNNKLYKFIENIITSYFNRNPTDTSVGSAEFVNFGLSLFRSIGTSKDELYQEIKSILDYWMFDIIDIKQFYQRPGTWSGYSRAIFNYMIFMINYYN